MNTQNFFFFFVFFFFFFFCFLFFVENQKKKRREKKEKKVQYTQKNSPEPDNNRKREPKKKGGVFFSFFLGPLSQTTKHDKEAQGRMVASDCPVVILLLEVLSRIISVELTHNNTRLSVSRCVFCGFLLSFFFFSLKKLY
eukprot:TRINITY_DN915_c0_g1_i1.p1 TRINITY_DN915_c0_g1~~TRINITY_DN915_c0_g1_i1.p1  ORF type:complete len:140 (-),score=7.52 TRINITY_DN915_c0_g1_i1:234-653(-)